MVDSAVQCELSGPVSWPDDDHIASQPFICDFCVVSSSSCIAQFKHKLHSFQSISDELVCRQVCDKLTNVFMENVLTECPQTSSDAMYQHRTVSQHDIYQLAISIDMVLKCDPSAVNISR